MAVSAMERRYQLAREDVSTQARGQTEQEKEALRRRFASIGGLNSGASIKAEQSAEREGARRLATGMSAITQQELGDQQRLEEIGDQRKYQTSERIGGQDFTAGENKVGREFMTTERVASQDFTSNENKVGREFATSERTAGQTFATGEREAGQDFQVKERGAAEAFSQKEQALLAELEKLKIKLSQDELDLNKEISKANLDVAKDSAAIQKKQAQGGIVTSILGTGITGGLTTKNARVGSSSSLFA